MPSAALPLAPAGRFRPPTVISETAGLAALSLLSPLAGLAVEMLLAWRFGASPVIDAYRVTVLLMLFGQQWLVTSILPYVIVPLFAEFRSQGKEEEAWAAADTLSWLLVALGSGIALFLFCRPVFVVHGLAPGMEGEGRLAAVFFVRWCGVAFIPLCWSGVACGILYAHEIFRIAPLAQFAANLALLLAILLSGAWPGSIAGVPSLTVGLVAGAWLSGALYAIRLTQVRRELALRPHPWSMRSGALRRVFRLAAPLIGGLVVGQATGAVVTRALSHLASGSLAAFGYSWKLGQIVLLVPSALSTVLFPKFSKYWQSKGREQFMEGYVRAFRSIFFIAMPMACFCCAERGSIIRLLLERGAFSPSDGNLTARLFGVLIMSTPGSAAMMYLDRMFCAIQDTRSPMIVDIAGGVILMAAAPAMAMRFGSIGAAVATMLLPWLLSGLLLGIFQYRHGGLPLKATGRFAVTVTVLGAGSAWFGKTLGTAVGALLANSSIPGIGIGALLAAVSFLTATLLLGLPEAADYQRNLFPTAKSAR